MAIVLHYLRTGERLLPDSYTRCRNTTSAGYRVFAGYFVAHGLGVEFLGRRPLRPRGHGGLPETSWIAA